MIVKREWARGPDRSLWRGSDFNFYQLEIEKDTSENPLISIITVETEDFVKPTVEESYIRFEI